MFLQHIFDPLDSCPSRAGLYVTVGSMSYTSVILVGLLALIIVGWFVFGHQFEGPKIDWEMLNLGMKWSRRAKDFEYKLCS